MSSSFDSREKRPTVRDVAAAAGVSKSLVSRAYTDPDRVRAESRELIFRTAKTLGYRPSWSARALTTADGDFIAVVMADLYSPSLAPMIAGAQRRLAAEGRNVLIAAASLAEPGRRRALDQEAIAFLGDLRPTRLLVVGAVHDMSSLRELADSVPVVIAGALSTDVPVAARVYTDNVQGMGLAVQHLRSLGHTKIAHMSGTGAVGAARAEAYVSAMVAAGLRHEVRMEPADFDEAEGYAAANRLLRSDDPPTAITAAGDFAAIGALGAADDLGLRATSVVGYGDVLPAQFQRIRLTTIAADNEGIGERAAAELLVADRGGAATRDIAIPPSLVVRSTTRPPGH
jgi:DNA-binding LacI/PurR family transcriptional regulator